MKILLYFSFSIIFVVSLLINKSNADPEELERDFIDFLNIVPSSDIVLAIRRHIANDEEFKNQVRELQHYLGSHEFNTNAMKISKNENVLAVLKVFEDNGIYIEKVFQPLQKYFEHLGSHGGRSKRDIQDLLDEVIQILPMDRFHSFIEEKRETSKSFAKLYNELTTAEMKQRYENISKIPELLEILSELKKRGLDLPKFIHDLGGKM